MACYPLQGSLSEPQTTAIVTFVKQCLPAGNTHSHTHTYTLTHTSWTHWVMMGLSSSIRACSSRLGSRAQSVEMDLSQEVLGQWFVASQPMCTILYAAERYIILFRWIKLIYFFVYSMSVSSLPHDAAPMTVGAEKSLLQIHFLDILRSV